MPSDTDQFHDTFTSTSHGRRQQSESQAMKPSPKILSLILRAIIMSLLTSIFFLFVGISAIFLTHLLLAGRHLQRRRQDHHSASDGMSNEVFHRLPGFRFDGGSELMECVICLDGINDGDLYRILPSCRHEFHLECIDRWLIKTSVCPVCRAKVCRNWGL